jgi:hypothetical protein
MSNPEEDTRSPMDRAREWFDTMSEDEIRMLSVQIKTLAVVREFVVFCKAPADLIADCAERVFPHFNYALADDHQAVSERAARLYREDVLVVEILQELFKITATTLDDWLIVVRPKLDHDFFWEMCKSTTVLKYRAFAHTQDELTAAIIQQEKEAAESSAKIEAAEKLHKILMTD